MWIILGVAAIITAILNVVWSIRNKNAHNVKAVNAKGFRFISLSLTALTLCAFYSANAKWVINEDWFALMDVVPTMSKALWVLTIVSILINSISLFKESDR